jgi:hypothetical protein
MATRFHDRPGDSEVSNFFHCVSRVVDRRFIFEEEEGGHGLGKQPCGFLHPQFLWFYSKPSFY